MHTKPTSIGHRISILYRLGQCYLDTELKVYGFGSGQFMFLMTLLKKDGISQETLTSILNIDKGTTARALHKLERAGYVLRITDPEDKRANLVYVTPKATKLKPALLEITSKWTNGLLENCTDKERDQVFRLLSRLAENALKLLR